MADDCPTCGVSNRNTYLAGRRVIGRLNGGRPRRGAFRLRRYLIWNQQGRRSGRTYVLCADPWHDRPEVPERLRAVRPDRGEATEHNRQRVERHRFLQRKERR